ncbi:hypothetical protein WPS_29560 [Vulcanimicrobium alpinum]|uniref:LPS-assembly protein LptD n=2 Tax=Vulcanimicrobium alpinum TaxID=3016050 RepID=A0AAN2CAH8_UNVUL|nr:hypothetical protein WPS_29560 [Vulcanimicrobium alpinum]
MRRAAALALFACALAPAAATARAAAMLDGGTVVFFSDTLALVARDGATLRLADGTRCSADAAYVDLKRNRAVCAGNARVVHGAASVRADAVALELDGPRVDLLDATDGVTRTTRDLRAPAPAEIDGERFAFPDVDDRTAYIRSRRATIVPRANVRFTPAAFPTSVGAVPVPSYLYTFATSAGFSASTLAGATFDQPYGLFGTPTALTSLHARWLQGPGGTLALQQQIAAGDAAYVTGAIDAPLRGNATTGISAYRRMGSRYTASFGASSQFGIRQANAAFGAAFGGAGGRLAYALQTGGFSTFDASLRSPDLALPRGATVRVTADLGFDGQRGGALSPYAILPDGRRYGTVWRHGVDVFVASPTLRGPLGTSLSATLDGARTWFAFPRRADTVTASASASKRVSAGVTLFAGYVNGWTSQVYPGLQTTFYPVPNPLPLAPDGTPYLGYGAFRGAAVARYANLDLQIAPPRSSTSVRLSLRHADDFVQFDGIGRPRWEFRGDTTFRPFPNVGLSFGRSYDFDWGGRRWIPGWSFAIQP